MPLEHLVQNPPLRLPALAMGTAKLHVQRRDPAREETLDQAGQGYDEITPSRAASSREEWERMCEALDRLSEDQREAILPHWIVGLEHSEIAAQLGRSEGAVRNLVYREMARVALWLEGPVRA